MTSVIYYLHALTVILRYSLNAVICLSCAVIYIPINIYFHYEVSAFNSVIQGIQGKYMYENVTRIGNFASNGLGANTLNKKKLIVCYYSIPENRSVTNEGALWPEQINPLLCTHIVIGFANIAGTHISPSHKSDIQIYKKVLSLRVENPRVKVMLSLSDGFYELVQNRTSVDMFAYNARQYLADNGFDGLDLDWNMPSWPFSFDDCDMKHNFTYLVIQLWNSLKLSSHPPFLLSLAVPGPRSIINCGYEAQILANNVDFLSMKGYDYRLYLSYFPLTGYNAPLFKGQKELGFFGTLNIAWSANNWVEQGIPREKLVVGIPTFGHTWRLYSFRWHGVGAPAVGVGMYGGNITYPCALNFLKSGAQHKFDNEHKVPYLFMGRNWVSYEDRESIANKVQWIKNNSFAGVMTWSLNDDDHEGLVSGRQFDLHHVINEVLLNS